MGGAAAFDEVLTAAQAGGDWAWERLFRSVAPQVRGYLAAQGASDPDDLAGEVLLGLVARIQQFEGDEAAFRSWVFMIAHHRLIDERRRDHRRSELSRRLAPTDHAGPADAELLERLAESDWAERLATLTEEQRTVLLLRVVGGLTVEQVADVVGRRPGAVRALQHRAIGRLREILSTGVTP